MARPSRGRQECHRHESHSHAGQHALASRATGADEAVGRSGGTIVAHEKTATYESNVVYSSVMFTGRLAPLPKDARPTRTIRRDESIEFAGQPIAYGYMPAAHTDGDLYVHVPRLNVLVAGGVVSTEGWPLLDHRNGAW
jgi:cyclase